MTVHKSRLPPESLDHIRVRRFGGDSVEEHARLNVGPCLPGFHEQLELSPTIACLQSLDLTIELVSGPFLVNFPSGSATVGLGDFFTELLQTAEDDRSDACQLMLETIGRWVLARHVAERETPKAGAREDTCAIANWFLVRPLLHSIWRGH